MDDKTPNQTRPGSSLPRFFNGGFFTNQETSPTSTLDAHKQFSKFLNDPFKFNKPQTKPTNLLQEFKNPFEKFDPEGIALALFQENPNSKIRNPNTINRKILLREKLKIEIPTSPSSPISSIGPPNSPGDFGIKTRNLGDPGQYGSGSPKTLMGPLSLSEMELSEDYTRVIFHGSNPKTTHIYDNCVVERSFGVFGSPGLKMEPGPKSSYGSFLSFCYTCKKNLGEGSDIFIYRGEKAFCSEECRNQEMILDGV